MLTALENPSFSLCSTCYRAIVFFRVFRVFIYKMCSAYNFRTYTQFLCVFVKCFTWFPNRARNPWTKLLPAFSRSPSPSVLPGEDVWGAGRPGTKTNDRIRMTETWWTWWCYSWNGMYQRKQIKDTFWILCHQNSRFKVYIHERLNFGNIWFLGIIPVSLLPLICKSSWLFWQLLKQNLNIVRHCYQIDNLPATEDRIPLVICTRSIMSLLFGPERMNCILYSCPWTF